jgi:hypothetical protein
MKYAVHAFPVLFAIAFCAGGFCARGETVDAAWRILGEEDDSPVTVMRVVRRMERDFTPALAAGAIRLNSPLVYRLAFPEMNAPLPAEEPFARELRALVSGFRGFQNSPGECHRDHLRRQ